MRIDKFLKVSRIIKRRTVAKEVCDGGKVKVNGRVAKLAQMLLVVTKSKSSSVKNCFVRALRKCVKQYQRKKPTVYTKFWFELKREQKDCENIMVEVTSTPQ